MFGNQNRLNSRNFPKQYKTFHIRCNLVFNNSLCIHDVLAICSAHPVTHSLISARAARVQLTVNGTEIGVSWVNVGVEFITEKWVSQLIKRNMSTINGSKIGCYWFIQVRDYSGLWGPRQLPRNHAF